MAERRIGLIMNGVTGRMGMNQHLIRSIAAIRADGAAAGEDSAGAPTRSAADATDAERRA